MQWMVSALPIAGQGPGTALAISSDGKKIGGQDEERPVIWYEEDGNWIRKVLYNNSGKVTGINIHGEFVGYLNRYVPGEASAKVAFYGSLESSRLMFLSWGKELGYGESEARAINDNGIVIGNQWNISGRDSDGFFWSKKDSQLKRFRINAKGESVITETFDPETESDEDIPADKLEVRTLLSAISNQNLVLGQAEQPEQKLGDYDVLNMFVYQYPR
jgi:uncharacterized membrane protein